MTCLVRNLLLLEGDDQDPGPTPMSVNTFYIR